MRSKLGVHQWLPTVWRNAADRHGPTFLVYGLFFKIRGLLMLPLLAAMLLTYSSAWHVDWANWAFGAPLFLFGFSTPLSAVLAIPPSS